MTFRKVLLPTLLTATFMLTVPATASAKSCSNVYAGGSTAYHLGVNTLSCSQARSKLAHWMRTSFPKSGSWYCLYGHRVNPNGWLCSKVEGKFASITFDLR